MARGPPRLRSIFLSPSSTTPITHLTPPLTHAHGVLVPPLRSSLLQVFEQASCGGASETRRAGDSFAD